MIIGTVIITTVAVLALTLLHGGVRRDLLDFVLRWHHDRLKKQIRALATERHRHVAALKLYASRECWIGSQFVGSGDPTIPAAHALRGWPAIGEPRFAEPSRRK